MIEMLRNLQTFADRCNAVNTSPVSVAFNHLMHRWAGMNIMATQRVLIRGEGSIITGGLLQVGMLRVGFSHEFDRTLLNVRGRLEFRGKYSIGAGCRFDIGPDAQATFGQGYTSCNTTFVITRQLEVGDDCSISWGCQFLDDDFHTVDYPGKQARNSAIRLGNHVLVGSRVNILKGVSIADDCVIASGSVVTASFDVPRCLIAGNPARVVREHVTWS